MKKDVRTKLEELHGIGWTLTDLIDLMKELEAITNYVEETGISTEEKLEKLFKILRIPTKVKGYQYLTKAILYYIEDSKVIKSLSKDLYLKIADFYNENPRSVERAIRTIIEIAFERGDLDFISELFPDYTTYKGGIPPIKTFISVIGEEVKKR